MQFNSMQFKAFQFKTKQKEKNRQKISLAAEIAYCEQVWKATLKHFGIERQLLEPEIFDIARAVQRHGVKTVELALLGARFEPAHEGFQPKDYVSLDRIFKPSRKDGKLKLTDFCNWGAKVKAAQSAETRKHVQEKVEGRVERTSPARVKEILAASRLKKIPSEAAS